MMCCHQNIPYMANYITANFRFMTESILYNLINETNKRKKHHTVLYVTFCHKQNQNANETC